MRKSIIGCLLVLVCILTVSSAFAVKSGYVVPSNVEEISKMGDIPAPPFVPEYRVSGWGTTRLRVDVISTANDWGYVDFVLNGINFLCTYDAAEDAWFVDLDKVYTGDKYTIQFTQNYIFGDEGMRKLCVQLSQDGVVTRKWIVDRFWGSALDRDERYQMWSWDGDGNLTLWADYDENVRVEYDRNGRITQYYYSYSWLQKSGHSSNASIHYDKNNQLIMINVICNDIDVTYRYMPGVGWQKASGRIFSDMVAEFTPCDGIDILDEDGTYRPIDPDTDFPPLSMSRTEVAVDPVTLEGEFEVGSPITAAMNAKYALAYNYWLFNDQGVIVQEHTNTTDTSWTFTVTEPGVYLLRTYATDFVTEDWADTDWFYISGESTTTPEPAPAVTVSNVTVSGDYKAGAPLTGTATVENAYAYNYWLFNDQGVIVAEHTNTTDTAWNFSVATPGLYLLRVYATDFLTEDWNDSEWFYVAEAAPANPVVVSSVSLSEANIHVGDTMTVVPSVSGGSGLYAYNYWVFDANGVIVKEKTNTLDSSASFTFTEPGVYLIRVYATDFESEDYTDSAWFSVIAAPAEQADEQPVEEAAEAEALPEELPAA